MKKRQSLTTGVLLITAIVIVVNIISYSWFFRLDLTKDKRYTLSATTLSLLKDLKQPVTVTAYISDNLPPQIAETRDDFKNLLTEYAARSGNKIVFNFINPGKNDTIEQQALKSGVQTVMINVREKDEMKKQKVYMGAVLKMGDKSEVIPFISPGGAMEYDISTCIRKMAIDKKPQVGLLIGNGEPGLEAMRQVYSSLSVSYNFHELTLADSLPIPNDYKTLVLVAPVDTFKKGQLKALDDFLARGGRLFIAYSAVNSDFKNRTGSVSNIGLTPWLASKGVVVEPKYVIDENCMNVKVQQNLNGAPMDMEVPFPFFIKITNFADNPITKGLGLVYALTVSPIKFIGDSNKMKYTVLATSSNRSGLLGAPLMFDFQRHWTQEDFQMSNLTVAAALKGVNGNADSRIVLVGCGRFAVNGTGQDLQRQEQDNIDLLANSVDWLSDDTGLIELRGKVITKYPLKDITDAMRNFLKYFNFLLPILLVVIYGFIRMRMKRSLRIKRMEETYDSQA